MRSFKVSATVLAVILGANGAAHAQNVLPGGWSTQFGYQTVGASGQGAYGAYGAGSSYNGWGNGGSGGVVVGPGYARRTPQYSHYPQPARTVNNLGPLGNAIGRTTRPRRSR